MPRSIYRFLAMLLLIGLLCQTRAGQSAAPLPRTPQQPVHTLPGVGPAQPGPAAQDLSGATAQERSGAAATFASTLKAVVFTGPIDGDNGDWTLDEIANAKLAAAALRTYGVSVQEFYPNQANGTWENIKAAANGAHILIYRGHGVYWGDMPYPPVGGFYLKNGVFVSNEMIRTELHPAKNFIVMLYGCFTAGSAGNDPISIDLTEAKRRVAMYASPFFDLGAAGYYADWFGEAFPSYINALFQGKTQRQAYEGFFDYASSLTWRGTLPGYSANSLYLGWDNWYDPKPNWNDAFAGQAERTLVDLFDTRMQLSTTQVTYLAESIFPAQTFPVTISSSSDTSFHWSVSSSTLPAWLTVVGPAEGESGEALQLRIDPALVGGVESVNLQVQAASAEVTNGSQVITTALKVVPQVWFTYLPGLGR
jgi:hypothetical protein